MARKTNKMLTALKETGTTIKALKHDIKILSMYSKDTSVLENKLEIERKLYKIQLEAWHNELPDSGGRKL